MNNKLPCELIRDLFPSYIDGLTSQVTNKIVEEHVADCEGCRDTLNAMREPTAEPADFNTHDKEEIDFLKKTRQKTQEIVLGCIITSVLVIAVVLTVKLFFAGSYVYSDSIACQVNVNGRQLSLSGVAADMNLGISSVEYEEKDGVVTVSFKGVRRSPFYDGEFQSDYTASADITQVCLGDRIVWAQGKNISAIASAVYNTRHPYVGEMPANGRTVIALNLTSYLGNFKNELQTSEEPYGWTMTLENEIYASQQERKERIMKAYACILIAVIDNLGEVSFEYTMDGSLHTVTVTADEASAFAGRDIKECGQDVVLLQNLIEKTGLDTYAYVNADNPWFGQEIQIDIVNSSDDSISGIGISCYRDGEFCQTQYSQNADGSLIGKGDSLTFTFYPEDFVSIAGNTADSTIKAEIYDKNGNCHEITSEFHVAAKAGAVYSYTLTGNAVDGYKIEQ